MGFLESVILGTIQGLTEFLPVSSSGHLAIAQHLFGLSKPMLAFDLLLHLGTQIAVVIFFWGKIKKLLKSLFTKRTKAWNAVIPLFLATVPVVIFGLFIREAVERAFTQLWLIGIFLIFTAGLLFRTKFLKTSNLKRSWEKLPWYKALLIGCFQAVAIFPGVSRSGSTIVGGMFTGLSPAKAFEFSFLAGLISISGASLVEVISDVYIRGKTGIFGSFGVAEFAGAAIAAIVGYLMLILVSKLIRTGRLWMFGFYCVAVAVFVFILAIR